MSELFCLSFLLPLLSQVTVTANGISVSSGDVSSILTPMTSWAWSFFNVIVAFASVIIVVFFVRLILWFIKTK